MPTTDPNAKPKAEPPVLDNAAIKLWAHDVFVERGKTYRYQVVAIITNPYFGHSPAMVPAQADKLAKAGIMRSPASEWTDPITVDPETLLFFTAATQDDPAAGRSATARAEAVSYTHLVFIVGVRQREWAEVPKVVRRVLRFCSTGRELRSAVMAKRSRQPAHAET